MFRPVILWSLWSCTGDFQEIIKLFCIFAKDWYNIKTVCLPGQKGVTLRRQKIHFTTFKEMKGKGEAAKWTWKTLLN